MYSVGGAVEFGETIREALAREVHEETGVGLPIGDLAAVEQAFFRGDDGHDWHQVCFYYWACVPDAFDPVCTSAGSLGEREHLRWVGKDDLADGMRIFPSFFRDALVGRWQGVRQYIERNGRYV